MDDLGTHCEKCGKSACLYCDACPADPKCTPNEYLCEGCGSCCGYMCTCQSCDTCRPLIRQFIIHSCKCANVKPAKQ